MKKRYEVLRSVIKLDMCNFLTEYFLLKRQVKIMYDKAKFISPTNKEYGVMGDKQCLGAWAHYGDIASDLVMKNMKSTMEKIYGKKLLETYSYVRVYERGHELKRHKDRYSCEVSATINLGGQEWPIFIAKDKKSGKAINVNEDGLGIKYIPSNDKGDQIILKPGDMLIYEGAKFEHWREPFTGTACIQLFIHYAVDNKKNKKRLYDSRPHLGLDSYFRGAIINDR
tara:strand:- start:283 stop:960 length:678 start_codon:yes stop_codon:yes gene_type:complete